MSCSKAFPYLAQTTKYSVQTLTETSSPLRLYPDKYFFFHLHRPNPEKNLLCLIHTEKTFVVFLTYESLAFSVEGKILANGIIEEDAQMFVYSYLVGNASKSRLYEKLRPKAYNQILYMTHYNILCIAHYVLPCWYRKRVAHP